MSLTGRFSALFLGALALVLVVFSTVLYVSARIYLDHRVGDRLRASLAVLAAAAEVHERGVEWEPQERILPLGQESGPDRLRWIVFDAQGHCIDHSRNLNDQELDADWLPAAGSARLPAKLVDREGRSWQVAQRLLRPDAAERPSSNSATALDERQPGDRSEAIHSALVLTVGVPLDAKESTLATLGLLLVTLSAGIWLLSAVLCRRLSRRALAPLARMVESARELNPDDPGWSLENAGTRDELDELGGAFNDLLSRLHVAYQQQRRFSSDVSHQLRTPLTILIGQIEVGLRQERSGDEYRRVLTAALNKATQLGRVVEALLFLGRADHDAQLPQGEPLDLGHWVAAFLNDRPNSHSAPEVVHVRADGQLLSVRVHPQLLGQLLENLLDNAFKYGNPGHSILVETYRDGDDAVLAVEDTGSGIAVDEQARVFEPFYRSLSRQQSPSRGVGLGLAIVHRIATAFGGRVDVRSEVGVGSRFEVRLPIAGSAAPSATENAVSLAATKVST